MKKGLFITFEGVDGCGKSTQARYLGEFLSEMGLEVVLTREPGGCPISEQIRSILLDVGNSSMNADTEALLYAAARAQHISEVILPALEAGKAVLCDRFINSSVAYQGFGRGLGLSKVLEYNSFAVKNCMPDYTLFLDFKPEDAKERMKKRTGTDRLEGETELFFKRVYDGFQSLREKYPERYIVVDVSGSKYETRDRIRAIAMEMTEKWLAF